jgi:hypothetical protein
MGLGSGIRKKPIPDPGSRDQKSTRSRIRIRNTVKKIGIISVIFKKEIPHVGNTESMLFTRLLHFLPRKFLDVLHQVRSLQYRFKYITNTLKLWMGVCKVCMKKSCYGRRSIQKSLRDSITTFFA